jgi:ribonucleoside-diphosphate reductase alpha chain
MAQQRMDTVVKDEDMAERQTRNAVRESDSDSRLRRREGLRISRMFTTPGRDPLDDVEWTYRSSKITNPDGSVVFELERAEVPEDWSQLATDIVVSKYFRKAGLYGDPNQGETSVRQVVYRLARTIREAGEQFGGYFASKEDADAFEAELSYMLVHQMGAFNSPVWFNCGIDEHPQVSACFINSVEDSMASILELAKTEGLIFKYGSGAGVNLSSLRSSKEPLSGGGTASGPVSFMRGYDAFAGVIKSGGKTRRAAKMVILDIDHPDVPEFIESKVKEEHKARVLIEAGYDPRLGVPNGAYESVFFQNANNSVRVTDDFMRAVVEDREWRTRAVTTGEPMETFRARELWRKIAEAAWEKLRALSPASRANLGRIIFDSMQRDLCIESRLA